MPTASGVRRRRPLPTAAALGILVVAALLASLALGSRPIPFPEVLGALFGSDATDNATVVTSQRLPRTMLALVAGTALGMAGALMQGHTRNPLADPGLFGVNAGAGFGVAVLVFGFGVASDSAIVLAALVGAGAVSVLVFVAGLNSMRGSALVTLAILGTTAAALLTALTSALIMLDRRTLDVLRFWEAGSLANPDTSTWWLVMPLIALGTALALANGVSLRALALGEDVAQTLGSRVRTARITGIAAITLLCGASTAVCGPIGFVGLVAPHAVRWAAGHDYRWLVPLAGLAGAVLLLAADTLGRVLTRPGELQAGIVMAALGAPVLLAITRRRRLVSL
ncbi:iron chelate uptake ABC transporter family permease subunit [Nocardioides sp. cx-169]|uniref:FecCD family ABC transporter permease n=1 Tax=Nocardioides sp. cx-169 TaxID=2899080 RepID=UPI001E466248|nr:iron chelate uptake ABC transporter family permease subunit [Nocardioides sp. cx-169]MCD4532819.1 iron chelate uptake ABC transporter family permease subunit [Nocardioides sp. cx-169]